MKNESDIPISLLAKLFDRTGAKSGGYKGYLMFFVNGAGEPSLLHKTENSATKIALEASMRKYLDAQDEWEDFSGLFEEE